ncbi:hypothetical protein PBI_SCTP2_100 [Salicola phage SCTP-2]|nr:hypothetical protein PBI_SCTP2_100 [Salicola phage SCTP-2]
MTDTAIFTDEGGDRVTLVHYMPDQLDQDRLNEARAMINKADMPEQPTVSEDEVARLYYTDANGLEYRVEKRSS